MRANDLASLAGHRDLLANLVRRDLRVKYKGSSIGVAWSLLHPLVMAGIYTLAFRYIVRIPIEHFPLFLLSGLMPWMFFSNAVSSATGAIVDNGSLVRKVAFPRAILPLAAVASQLVQFLVMYVVIVPVAILSGVGLSLALVALVPVIALQAIFTIGVGLLTATAYVHLRDVRHLLEVLLQITFWLTPIVYAVTLVPGALRPFLWLNPMTHFVTAYQQIVVQHRTPDATAFAVMAAFACAALVIGMSLFVRYERRFAELA
jgi:lipopolysaccharide transport system permease protein